MSADPCELSLVAAVQAVRRGTISALELTEACLARIAARDGELCAFITLEPERARQAALAADAQRQRGEALGPLHGIPLAHKDLFCRAGRPTTCGSRLWTDFVPDYSASLLEFLEAAGAIDLGSLNMSEFAFHPDGMNVLKGPARNPWDPSRVAGGSSGGSAAALAAGFVFGSLGSDSGGSIRSPAALNGVVGLLPSFGRLRRRGMVVSSASLDGPGPMARSAADCAQLFSVLTGAAPAPSLALAGHRIGVPPGATLQGLPAALGAALTGAIETWAQAGARIVEVTLPDLASLNALAGIIFACEVAATHADSLRRQAADFTPAVRQRLLIGFGFTADDYLRAVEVRSAAQAEFLARAFAYVDTLLLPSAADVAPKLSEVEARAAEPVLSGAAFELATPADPSYFTRAINYLGLPALALPCGSSQDLPLGFQLVGRPLADEYLLGLGQAFEKLARISHRVTACVAPR